MIDIKSNGGHVEMDMHGTMKQVLADLVFGVRAVFEGVAVDKGNEIGYVFFSSFLEAFNEGAPLDWDEIAKSDKKC